MGLKWLKRLKTLAEMHLKTPTKGPARMAAQDRKAVPSRSRQPLVLIVDDTETVRQRLRVGFENDGFEVIEAENGMSALEKAREYKPDVIILDVRMPSMDGFEVQRLIRNEESLQHTHIFFLTSTRSLNVQKIKTALAYGIKGYIPKTMPLPEIVEKARSVL